MKTLTDWTVFWLAVAGGFCLGLALSAALFLWAVTL